MLKAMQSLSDMLGLGEPRQMRQYGPAPGEPLVVRRCDPSQHNTLRHGQVERKRKLRNRAGRKPNKPFVKQYAS